MNFKIFLKGLVLFMLAFVGSYIIYYFPVSLEEQIDNINLDKYKKVMIVAHPDDEMLWGGAHLIEDDYLVVCITCGTSAKRLKEFKEVMKATDDSFIYLGYPDKDNDIRNEWETCYNNIYFDIEKILNSNKWDLIVTHNPKGEYGHIQHIKTNKIITDIYNSNNYNSKLYFFGKYYSKKNIINMETHLIPVSEKLLEEKKKILDLYDSQSKVIDNFSFIYKYEMWEEYGGKYNEERFKENSF
ncbi:MAG: PIG-L family deacetylase [Bacilli bacterium]|nr:PIG-L family deacetylase [Bacilli bacterium]